MMRWDAKAYTLKTGLDQKEKSQPPRGDAGQGALAGCQAGSKGRRGGKRIKTNLVPEKRTAGGIP